MEGLLIAASASEDSADSSESSDEEQPHRKGPAVGKKASEESSSPNENRAPAARDSAKGGSRAPSKSPQVAKQRKVMAQWSDEDE
jgi:hypothetical protein